MTIPERIKKQLLTITMIGGAIRVLLLLLPKYFLVTYRLPDDAMYYFTIARNLASGKGISFDGVDPTNGFHPLWLFVITPIYWLTGGLWDSVYVILVLQSLLDTALIFACGYAAYKALDLDESQRHFSALAAAMIYAFNPITVIRGINGLETTLAALLLTVWFIEYLKLWRAEKDGYLTLAVLSALVFLARTDLVFLLLPSLIVLLIKDVKRRQSFTKYLLPTAIALAIVAPWLIWSYAMFGSIVQTSGEAVAFFAQKKFEIEFANGGRGGYIISELIRSWLKPFIYSSYAVGAIALLLLVMKRTSRESLLPYLPLILGVLALYTYHIVSRGFIRDWYVIQFIPVFVVLAAISFAQFTQSRRLFLWITLTLLFCGWIWELTHPRMESQAVLSEISRSPKPYLKGGFNSGYFGYLSGGRVVNLDGVVNNGVLYYLRIGDMRRYIDSLHIDEIQDFRGTLGGYRNLFAPNLTEGFTLIDTIDAGGGEIFETWWRNTLLKP
jgi:hypothetical protein